MRTALQAAIAIAFAAVGACAHYPATPGLLEYAPSVGYRFANTPPTSANSDSLMVILTFSGGGTRAAALSTGVLRELDRTAVPGEPGRTLLDEVDIISSVSGGSFTAAYFALHGREGLDRFETEFLDWNAQAALKRDLLAPMRIIRLLSRNYSRIDHAAATWDQRLFGDATFGDLIGRRPLIIINAADMSLGATFSFTQEQFDPLCANLADFPLSRAVAASSAFPGLLSPLTLENHGDDCGFEAPGWVENALEDADIGGDRYRLARHLLTYRDTDVRPFVHLLDGGLADNIGLRPILRSLTSTSGDWSVLRMINNGQVRRVVVIVVNAKTDTRSNVDLREQPPGIKRVLQTVVSTPLGNYSRESVQRLREVSDDFLRELTATPSTALPEVHFHAIEVSFDGLDDVEERRYFETLPTSFRLPPDVVDQLTEVGGRLLREAEEFQALLAQF
ncbi:MAG: patatin-like phospholipase family protein [Gemmatimonas sp.]|nr:patatin-like phospholipase family protein [Gemmatimonas sp.]